MANSETEKLVKTSSYKELSTKRSSIKGQITKFKNYLASFDSVELTSIQLAELSLKLTRFESLSVKFDSLQSEIEVLNSNNLTAELDERDAIECDIIYCIANAKNIIDENDTQMEARRRSFAPELPLCHHSSREDPDFNLPRIQIPKFNGSCFGWLEFRDTFQDLVHNNQRINDIHKFRYLNSYLEGDAKGLLSNFEVSSSNYSKAWSLLCERYDDKKVLIDFHLSELFNIPLIKQDSESLRGLVDHITKNLRALSSLGQPTDQWDTLIVYIYSSKLDSATLVKWEETRNTYKDTPTLDQFHKFLIERASVLASVKKRNKFENSFKTQQVLSKPNPRFYSPQTYIQNKHNSSMNNNQNRNFNVKSFTTTNQNNIIKPICVICNDSHRVYECRIFRGKSIQERLNDVKQRNLCINCLRPGHHVSKCCLGPCRECNKKHNTLIHNADILVESPGTTDQSISTFSKQYPNQVILSTAIIEVSNPVTGHTEKVRALLDCGSQSSFISNYLKQKLQLNTNKINTTNIIGIGNNSCNNVVESCTIKLKSMYDSYNTILTCLVLDELTGELPTAAINIQTILLPKHIQLADPSFHLPSKVHVLLGADVFWEVFGSNQQSLGPTFPKLIDSKFGWLIAGPIHASISQQTLCNYGNILSFETQTINNTLSKFWEVEEVPQKSILSQSEKACEEHFLSNTTRLSNGRFCVKLPLLDNPDCLGDSYSLARKRFLSLEKRFRRDPNLKLQYSQFIREYSDLGHLSISENPKPPINYFLSHHAVFKEDSESSKIRVVFDGSTPSSSGYSLNDILMVGPHIQNSLFSILVRARQYKFLLTGDIEKMYRQCQLNPDDRNLQLILWREEESQTLQTLELATVTYGTSSASFLSTRCLWQVGEECEDESIKTIIQNDFLVDDLITGFNSDIELRRAQKAISKALSAACFPLRKYKSNLPDFIEIDENTQNDKLILSEASSTLGVGWNPTNDYIHYPIKLTSMSNKDKVTKRSILSNAFKIFDPLGLLSPCIIQPKMLLQRLWLLHINWDEPVPHEIEKSWDEFSNSLPHILSFKIPRTVLCDDPVVIELHSFSDASMCAYGACIYIRSINANNQVSINLLCAKSKVSPLKPMTIPRLELCAALLAARLTKAVLESIRYLPNRMIHWCDSSVVLAWIQTPPRNLKTFVANRIGEIIETTQSSSWKYVPTHDNPADLISRGADACQLLGSNLWWHGPTFLTENESEWPTLQTKTNKIDLPEIKSISAVVTQTQETSFNFEDFSQFSRLHRSFAYIKRFLYNLRNPGSKRSGILNTDELNDSFLHLCQIAQQQSFPIEYKLLNQNKSLNHKSKLLPLSPFIDNKLIRVGGRINASNYTYSKKHPILLDSNHYFTKLYFEREHIHHLHAGPQLLLATIRETVWPLNGRHLARRTVHNCGICRRFQAKTLCPKMGNLPRQRVTPDYPFISVGVDYAGPFYILNRKGRGSRLIKCYLCLFICMRYKCVHLEAVSSLSKDDYLLALRRFISRRGKPAEIFSDNGRNFVGAANELGSFLKLNNIPLSDFAAQEGINFKFIPSYTPHFGGIWESAGIKSAKFHVKRVIGNSHLTFEELQTLFTQVEAILNSRPMYPMSSDPNDFLSLTPGHFIIGRSLTSIPSPLLEDINPNKLQRYQKLEQLRQHFWSRWQREYICELQQRQKWTTDNTTLYLGDLTLIKEDSVPPLCWRLGRVTRLYPGPDGISRVADLKTSSGTIRRALHRLCPLPKQET